jgi:hypothetical protein
MTFINLKRYEDNSKNSKVVNVLYKSPYLKSKLEEEIGVVLDHNYELSSVIDIDEETFDINKHLIKNE